MKIVIGLYYYYPYISGLSVYTRKLAESLAAQGHDVTIVTSRYDKNLDVKEYVNGVTIRRIPVAFRLDKGVIMPLFVPTLLRLGRTADIINLHLPMAEASAIAALMPRKTVITYICDPRLNSRNPVGLLFEKAVYQSLDIAVQRAAATVAMSFDYAANSRIMSHHLDKVWVVPPPIDFVSASEGDIENDYFNHRADVPPGAKTVGFLGRIVYEKGIDFLIHAMEDLQKKHDDVYLVIAGDYKDVAGGSVKSTLMHFLSGSSTRVRFTGRLTDAEVDAFYRFIDVLALPSIDPLEAYGMVQVEAMLRGTPVVATDMPGVRMIVQRTGMGKIVPRRDPHALAGALEQIMYHQAFTTQSPEEIFRLLDLGNTTEMYLDLFERVRTDTLVQEPEQTEQVREVSR